VKTELDLWIHENRVFLLGRHVRCWRLTLSLVEYGKDFRTKLEKCGKRRESLIQIIQ